MVEPENPDALAEAMIKAGQSTSPRARSTSCTSTASSSENKYDKGNFTNRLFQIYEDLASTTKVISA
ncbi:hypothetical protein [Nostoc sp.]